MTEKKHIVTFLLWSPDEDGLRDLEPLMRTLHFEAWAQQDRSDITGVEVQADAPKYSGRCPITLRFSATIHVDHAPLTVTYWWERSHGTRSKAQVVEIPADGNLIISAVDAWAAGIPRESLWTISDGLHVRVEDVDFVSEPAHSSLSCRNPSQ